MCFIDHFSALDDPRKDINIRYDFLDIVFLTVCAVVSGAEGWKDIKQFDDEKSCGCASTGLTSTVYRSMTQ